MALVEGHAEHVMDAAGGPLVPDLPRLRAQLERRRAERSPLASILDRLLGLEMKLRQYRDGKAFCDAVVAHEGTCRSEPRIRRPGAAADQRGTRRSAGLDRPLARANSRAPCNSPRREAYEQMYDEQLFVFVVH